MFIQNKRDNHISRSILKGLIPNAYKRLNSQNIGVSLNKKGKLVLNYGHV